VEGDRLDQVGQSIVGRRRNSPVGIGNAFRRGSGSAIGGAIPGTLRPALGAIAVKVRTLFEHRGRPPSGPLYIADVCFRAWMRLQCSYARPH
jgi:hypothetical protein